MAVRTLKAIENATLVARESADAGLCRVWIEPDAGPLAFRAGQYVTLGVWDDEGRPILRPMTIASPPEHDGPLEFVFNRVEHPASACPLSHRLADLATESRLFLRPAATGRFTLEDTEVTRRPRKLLIAQGTGIAPFLSMVRSRAMRAADLSDLILWHEVNEPETLIFDDELRALTQEGLQYTVWTQDSLRSNLDDGLRALQQRLHSAGVSLTPDVCPALVCGLASIIRPVVETLLGWGYVPPQHRLRRALSLTRPPSLFVEQYDQERLFDLRDDATVRRLCRKLPS